MIPIYAVIALRHRIHASDNLRVVGVSIENKFEFGRFG